MNSLIDCPIAPTGGWGSQKPPPGVPIDWSHPLSKGLVCKPLANEGCGSRIYDAASGKSFVLQGSGGSAVWNARPGWLTFNGVDDCMSMPAACKTAASPFSFLCRLNDITTQYWGTLWEVFTGSTSGFGVAWYQQSIDVQNNWVRRITPYNLLAKKDYAVAVTYAGGTDYSGVHIYLNGVETTYSSNRSGGLNTGDSTWYIGGAPPNTSTFPYFSGSLTDIAFYNRALSPVEVYRYYQNPYSMFASAQPSAFDDDDLFRIHSPGRRGSRGVMATC